MPTSGLRLRCLMQVAGWGGRGREWSGSDRIDGVEAYILTLLMHGASVLRLGHFFKSDPNLLKREAGPGKGVRIPPRRGKGARGTPYYPTRYPPQCAGPGRYATFS